MPIISQSNTLHLNMEKWNAFR